MEVKSSEQDVDSIPTENFTPQVIQDSGKTLSEQINDMEFATSLRKSKSRTGSTASTIHYDAFHVVLSKPDMEQKDDIFKNLKFFLVVGRILGVLPYSGIFKKNSSQLHFSPKSPAAILSFVILAVLTVNVIFGAVDTIRLPKTNALEIANSARASIQFVWSWLIYFNFLLRGKKFLSLFYHWKKTSLFYETEDRHLRRDVIFITLLILVSAILENAILNLEYIQALDHISGKRFGNSTDGVSALEAYYKRSHGHWASILKFHEIFAVIAFIQHKWMLYGCNYMDIMLAVFSRALYFKFKILHKLSHEYLVNPQKKETGIPRSTKAISYHAWIKVVQDHKKLCDLLQQLENFFSPLVFGSFTVNIYYICIQLFDGLTTDITSNSLVHSIYAPWSFLHIIMRIYIVSICAARINVYAHQIRNVLQECPIDQYVTEVARLDKKVTTGPDIGLTGLGCFIVTKPFILRIIGVVFTFEIVLLQGNPNPPTTSGQIKC